MSAALLSAARPAPQSRACGLSWQPTLFDLDGDPTTLDELVSNAWEGLVAAGTAPCPVCGERLVAVGEPGTGAAEGRCRGCGSVLS